MNICIQNYQEVLREPHPTLDGIFIRKLADLEGKRIKNLNLRIFEVQPDTENDLHAHGYSHDLFVIEGEGVVRLSNDDQSIKEGDVVHIAPGESHSFANAGGSELRFLCIDYRMEG